VLAEVARRVRFSLDYPAAAKEIWGFDADQYQASVLNNRDANHCLTCHRQFGKTEVVSSLAACATVFPSPSVKSPTSIILSTGQDHAAEVLRRVGDSITSAARAGLCEVKNQNKHSIELKGIGTRQGARVISLASTEKAPRGWVVGPGGWLIVDEAAFVSDDVMTGAFPLTSSGGHIALLSTPNGKRGVFADVALSDDDHWQRLLIDAPTSGRISPGKLEQYKLALGSRKYGQEYLCDFLDTANNPFNWEELQGAMGGSSLPADDGIEIISKDIYRASTNPFSLQQRFV
jgi:hypothetical protein